MTLSDRAADAKIGSRASRIFEDLPDAGSVREDMGETLCLSSLVSLKRCGANNVFE